MTEYYDQVHDAGGHHGHGSETSGGFLGEFTCCYIWFFYYETKTSNRDSFFQQSLKSIVSELTEKWTSQQSSLRGATSLCHVHEPKDAW